MDGLSLISTPDLIKELVGRSTFAGLILFSPENHRSDDQVHSDFHLLTTACKEDAISLMENAIKVLKNS